MTPLDCTPHQVSWARDYKLEQAHVATETTRWRKLALRAAVTLLTVRMGVSAQCGVALRRWRLSILSLDCERLVYLTAMRARSERLERALLASDKAGSLMSCLVALHRWRRVGTIREAERALHDERVRAAHIARMLEGARAQLAQRVKLPLQLEEELSSSRAALEAELLRAKEAVNASKVAHKQADAAKAQRDAMESALRRAEAQLRAMQRDRSRLEARPVTAEHATQAGLALDGSEGDDGSALELAARQSAQAVAAATSAAAAANASAATAPHRAAVLVRLLLGLRTSGPMLLLSALVHWRQRVWRRRAASEHQRRLVQLQVAEAARTERELAEAALLRRELGAADERLTADHGLMLQRVLDERERRVAAERAHKAVSTPLAVQQETKELKEALRLEVLARQEAEAKAARLQRSTAALESQYRIASETAQRLQRQHRGSPSAGGGAAGAGGLGSSSSTWK